MSFVNPKWFERFPRTITKAVTWRSWMMVTNSVIGWIVSGDPWKGLTTVSYTHLTLPTKA